MNEATACLGTHMHAHNAQVHMTNGTISLCISTYIQLVSHQSHVGHSCVGYVASARAEINLCISLPFFYRFRRI